MRRAMMACVMACVLGAGVTGAEVIWDANGAGNWNVGGNWSGGSIPTAADDARIGDPANFGAKDQVTLQAAGAAAVADVLYVGWRSSTSLGSLGALTIDATNPTDVRMTVANLNIGYNIDQSNAREGDVTQNNGVVNVTGTLTLARDQGGSNSSYSLLGGTLNVGGVVLGTAPNQGDARGDNASITQAAGTVFGVTNDYWMDRGVSGSVVRTHTVDSGAALDIGGSILAAGVFGLTNNGGDVDVDGTIVAGNLRACAASNAWGMTGGTMDVGGLFDFDDLDMTVSGGVLTANDLNIQSASILTISDAGIVRVLQSNYSEADALTDIGNSRIVGSELVVSTVNAGGSDYTQIAMEQLPVAEPGSALLLLIGGALGLRRRRR